MGLDLLTLDLYASAFIRKYHLDCEFHSKARTPLLSNMEAFVSDDRSFVALCNTLMQLEEETVQHCDEIAMALHCHPPSRITPPCSRSSALTDRLPASRTRITRDQPCRTHVSHLFAPCPKCVCWVSKEKGAYALPFFYLQDCRLSCYAFESRMKAMCRKRW
ncbi:hypothetical protein AVEN_201763-1 [Araneus ventricosus]|uniref:Uncharacterized protein n=1 Tax=Araneus ventricosus TaxID=182803 RepID=A0A4Y2J132_ARAVE|nr:hypothetical protein AVEN_201763-1 [Araneus ventricosus]